MYVKIEDLNNGSVVLIKDPSIQMAKVDKDGNCKVAIENGYLSVTASSFVKDVLKIMRSVNKKELGYIKVTDSRVFSQNEFLAYSMLRLQKEKD